MEFRIADTFTDSLSKLTAQEQKAVKTTAFDLQLDVSTPGFSFHKLDRAKDPNFWSVRVNADIRLIVHRTQSSLLLVYVDHHDDAYKWAERRKIERHPTTGAMQLVEVRERVEEVEIFKPTEVPEPVAVPTAACMGFILSRPMTAVGLNLRGSDRRPALLPVITGRCSRSGGNAFRTETPSTSLTSHRDDIRLSGTGPRAGSTSQGQGGSDAGSRSRVPSPL